MNAGRSRFARIVAAVAVPVAALVAIVIALHSGRPGVGTFNSCLSHLRFLVATEHKSGGRIIDTVTDRSHGTVVGEFTVFPSLSAPESLTNAIPPDGTVENNGPMVLFTRVSTGRDANAVLTCGIPEFPVAP